MSWVMKKELNSPVTCESTTLVVSWILRYMDVVPQRHVKWLEIKVFAYAFNNVLDNVPQVDTFVLKPNHKSSNRCDKKVYFMKSWIKSVHFVCKSVVKISITIYSKSRLQSCQSFVEKSRMHQRHVLAFNLHAHL